jgi:hypothetical protein
MLENLPRLAILPVDSLVIHEYHDDQRTPPLIARIRQEGVWRNPPIVTPLLDGSDRFMVLDGANRTVALEKMGIPHALVQVVLPDDSGLRLYNWNHVVWGLKPADFLSPIRVLDDLELVPGRDDRPDLWGDCGLASIQTARGDLFTVCTSTHELVQRLNILHALVDTYKNRARLDRTSEWSVVRLKAMYPDLAGLVIFPHFEVRQVLKLASEGYLLPTGITRFTVSPRALHLNYPLKELTAEKPLSEKNDSLQQFVQEQVTKKAVRYYAEATVLFDE